MCHGTKKKIVTWEKRGHLPDYSPGLVQDKGTKSGNSVQARGDVGTDGSDPTA